MGRVFTNFPGDTNTYIHMLILSISGRVIAKPLKMVLDTSLLNTQQYKLCIKCKVEQSWERSNALPYTPAIEKGAFWSPSTTVANFTCCSWYYSTSVPSLISHNLTSFDNINSHKLLQWYHCTEVASRLSQHQISFNDIKSQKKKKTSMISHYTISLNEIYAYRCL